MIKLDPDEKIIIAVRKHWYILFAETFFLVFLTFLPFAVFAVFRSFASELSQFFARAAVEGNALYLLFAALFAWLLFLWLTFFAVWTDYYLDILILTNKRLVDIEQRGFFSREVSTLQLERIQDITADVRGIIPTLLDFGDIHIQTAGQKREFVAKGIGRPYRVKEKILAEYSRT